MVTRFIIGFVGFFCLEFGFDKRLIIGFLGLEEFWFLILVRFGEELDLCNFGFFIEDCFFIGDCCCFCVLDCGVIYVFLVVGGF